MSRHRVDFDLRGVSHYVNGQLQGTSKYGSWPDGLHLSAGNPVNKTKKFVRKKGVGRSIEWDSDRV